MRTTQPNVRPSDLGLWRRSEDGTRARWVWIYDPREVRVLDRTPTTEAHRREVRRQGSTFRLELETPEISDPNGSDRTYRTTCGGHKGGTRHTAHPTPWAAQEAALAWLDRRYRAEIREI